jgi:hypothetical protein
MRDRNDFRTYFLTSFQLIGFEHLQYYLSGLRNIFLKEARPCQISLLSIAPAVLRLLSITNVLKIIFRHKIFKMLLAKGKITEDLVGMLLNWRHSGFNVFCGQRIQPGDEKAMENLARCIVRASCSQERMSYIPEESKVAYQSKDGKEEKVFDALEWLAAMCSHVPNKGEQMVRYYGYYSNVSLGKRKMQDVDELIPSILEPDEPSKESRKNWARLIQKIYETDPLCCPRCHGRMKVISVIEDSEIVKKILKHLGLWEVKARPPPKTGAPQPNVRIDKSNSQVPPCEDYLFHDPGYPIEAYI